MARVQDSSGWLLLAVRCVVVWALAVPIYGLDAVLVAIELVLKARRLSAEHVRNKCDAVPGRGS